MAIDFHIDGYELQRKLGGGGMGNVFLARQLSLERPVAIKLVPAVYTQNELISERLQREAEVSARLSHPNVVCAYDAVPTEDGLAYVMEFVEGESLEDLVKQRGPLDERRALELFCGLFRALELFQARGLVHRDIKPANVLIATGGYAKLCDLGVVRDQTVVSELTRTGALVGTPAYSSAEHLENAKDLDIRADIYGLGASLFYALTGQPPFSGPSTKVYYQITMKPTPRLRDVGAFSAPLDELVGRMMAKKRDDRFATPTEALTAIRAHLDTLPPKPFPAKPLNLRSTRLGTADDSNLVIIVGLVLILVLLILFFDPAMIQP